MHNYGEHTGAQQHVNLPLPSPPSHVPGSNLHSYKKATPSAGPCFVQRKGLNLTQLWADYTVVTTVRNPWARAASGYEYTFEQWTERDPNGPCAKPPFLDYCRYRFSAWLQHDHAEWQSHQADMAWYYHPAWHWTRKHSKPHLLHHDVAGAWVGGLLAGTRSSWARWPTCSSATRASRPSHASRPASGHGGRPAQEVRR